MKNQYAVFVNNKQFTCDEHENGVVVYYDEVNPRIEIGFVPISMPSLEPDEDESLKFETVIKDFVLGNVEFPVSFETLTLVGSPKIENSREALTPFSRNNLEIIENFLLHYFAPDVNKNGILYEKMCDAAYNYILEDHVNGEDSEQAQEQRERIEPTLKALDIVENNAELRAEFAARFNDDFDNHRKLIQMDLFKPNAALMLKRLAQRK